MNRVIIAGCGPGSREHLTFAAVQAVEKADLLVGPPRLLDLFNRITCDKLILKGNYQEALKVIDQKRGETRVVVLVTGDPGVHSFARSVVKKLGRSSCKVLPGVSAVQYAFALLGMTWEDAVIYSCHGHDLEGVDAVILNNSKVAILTSGEEDPAAVGRALAPDSVRGKSIYLCENLSLPGERVVRLTLEQLRSSGAAPLNVIIVVKEDQP